MKHKIQNWLNLTHAERIVITTALVGLPGIRLALKLWKYQTVYKWLGYCSPLFWGVSYSRQLSPETVARLIHIAADHGLIKTNCLPRSLWLYHWLHRQNYAVQLQLGVKQMNGQFEAHAWVEYQGNPLAERANPYEKFTPLPF